MDYLCRCQDSKEPVTITTNSYLGLNKKLVSGICNNITCNHCIDCEFRMEPSYYGIKYQPDLTIM